MVNRLEQKSSLMFKLGALFGPLLKLTENPDQFNQQERAEVLARYFFEYPRLQEEFRSFSTGQPGHNYAVEFHKFNDALDAVRYMLIGGASLETILHERIAIAQLAIDSIPTPSTSVILEAGSPFTAYCRLCELCETDATSSLFWLDPYLGASVFPRYISKVRSTVPITLVTCDPGPNTGSRDRTRWSEFLDLSRLFASERGPSFYSLFVHPSLHDRWVVFDEKRIYSLGGSAKDAAQKDYFTIAEVEATPTNLKQIRELINGGSEFFGPTTPVHK